MSIKFYYDDNQLIVESNKIVFDHTIRYVLELSDVLIILLEIPTNTKYLNNVYGVNRHGEKKWRIQSVKDVFDIKKQLPFENLMMNGTDVFVSDFYGRRFLLNPNNGMVISSDVNR